MSEPIPGPGASRPLKTPGHYAYADPGDPNANCFTGRRPYATPGSLGRNDAAEPPLPAADCQVANEAINEFVVTAPAVFEKINTYIDRAVRTHEMLAEEMEGRSPAEQAEMRKALGRPPTGDIFEPVAYYLGEALNLATTDRKNNPYDEVTRNAQYYFHTRWRVADTPDWRKEKEAEWGIEAAIAWDAAKWLLPPDLVQKWMQADKNKPNSPPGGWIWGVVGSLDGVSDLKALRGKPRYPERVSRQQLLKALAPLLFPCPKRPRK
jgi:hypothetical protein